MVLELERTVEQHTHHDLSVMIADELRLLQGRPFETTRRPSVRGFLQRFIVWKAWPAGAWLPEE